MQIYIQGSGCVSPQETAQGGPFPSTVREYRQERLAVADPDYKQWIDLKQIRRMSRVIKMGVAAAQLGLQEAGVTMPDAIITGSAYGCLDDTGVFLTKMVQQQEEMLTPTAFIQSTHNTVAGQIALLLGCHAYNNTFVHRGFSFENALQDSIMLLRETPGKQILTGGLDEITNHSHHILSRFGLYKRPAVSNLELLQSNTGGTIAGEGAAFFLLGTDKGPDTKVMLEGVQTVYKPAGEEAIIHRLSGFLAEHHCAAGDLDLLITGRNGDSTTDKIYDHIKTALFPQQPEACFKHLCGEYPTASAFGMWTANKIITENNVPPAAMYNGTAPTKINRVLLYNHHQGTHHSFILLSAC